MRLDLLVLKVINFDKCDVNPPVTVGFPSQRPVMGSFDVFFDMRLNKRLSKQSIRQLFEMPDSSQTAFKSILTVAPYSKTA